MGQSIHRLSFCNADCALSVQKKYFILQMLKQLYILFKPATGKDLLTYRRNPLLARLS